MSTPWRDKANRIISSLCYESWKQTNFSPSGKQYKKHRPYSVPDLARDLVDCLGALNQVAAEEKAKSLFLSYEGLQAIS